MGPGDLGCRAGIRIYGLGVKVRVYVIMGRGLGIGVYGYGRWLLGIREGGQGRAGGLGYAYSKGLESFRLKATSLDLYGWWSKLWSLFGYPEY